MSQKKHSILLNKLLLSGNKYNRLISAWIALFIGFVLLFLALLIWVDFSKILNSNNSQDSLGGSFLTISKIVDNAVMSDNSKTYFSEKEINLIKNAPEVKDLGLLTPANFKVAANMGSGPFSFYTLLFLEATPEKFLDQKPEYWEWKEGDQTLPIILSRDYLNMYNYIFAPSQGLPLLSEQSVKALSFVLTVGEGNLQKEYRAQVEGFSDRISSVLVPESFIKYGNKTFGLSQESKASRLIVKIKDPSNKAFISFLENNHLTTNKEQLKFNKLRTIVQVISSVTGAFAILFLLVGTIVLILFIELTISKSKQTISLLLQIGYSPNSITTFLQKKYIPLIFFALIAALASVLIIQKFITSQLIKLGISISSMLPLLIWVVFILCAISLTFIIKVAIKKAIYSK